MQLFKFSPKANVEVSEHVTLSFHIYKMFIHLFLQRTFTVFLLIPHWHGWLMASIFNSSFQQFNQNKQVSALHVLSLSHPRCVCLSLSLWVMTPAVTQGVLNYFWVMTPAITQGALNYFWVMIPAITQGVLIYLWVMPPPPKKNKNWGALTYFWVMIPNHHKGVLICFWVKKHQYMLQSHFTLSGK